MHDIRSQPMVDIVRHINVGTQSAGAFPVVNRVQHRLPCRYTEFDQRIEAIFFKAIFSVSCGVFMFDFMMLARRALDRDIRQEQNLPILHPR